MVDPHHSDSIARTDSEERDYLLRRPNDHRGLAEQCGETGPRLIHQRLQQLYEKQAELIIIVLPD